MSLHDIPFDNTNSLEIRNGVMQLAPGEKNDAWVWWERHVGALCEELAARNRIIDKLHKTADGVPVMLGMTVWFWNAHAVVRRIYDTDEGEIWLAVEDANGPQGGVPLTECYSTLTAYAEAHISVDQRPARCRSSLPC